MSQPSQVIEADLDEATIEAIHKFGECWIIRYDGSIRDHWKKAVWLWAWSSMPIWDETKEQA